MRAVPAPPRLAVLLIGGFGRGEGGVLRAADGSWRGFNDYDLVVLLDGPFDEAPMSLLAADMARDVDIDFVDIGFIRLGVLEAGPLDTVYGYELRAGHRVLEGPADILDRMPVVDPATLPVVEATRLLVNRGWGLVWARLHLEEAAANPSSFDHRRRRFTVNAMMKGVLAIGEAGLLADGRYHFSYRERARRVAALPLAWFGGQAGQVREAIAAATEFKLSPRIPEDSPDVLTGQWTRIRDWHEATLGHIEERRTGRPIRGWPAWSGAIRRQGLLASARRPRRFLAERAPGVAGDGLGHLGLDRDHDFRRRLPALLYGFGAERLDDAWRSAARRQLAAWHP